MGFGIGMCPNGFGTGTGKVKNLIRNRVYTQVHVTQTCLSNRIIMLYITYLIINIKNKTLNNFFINIYLFYIYKLNITTCY